MSNLAIEVGTPISCFVDVKQFEAHVTFFAQNGQEDDFCGHGLISVIKHLKQSNLDYIDTLVSASGVKLTARILENGMSSLEIPVSKFEVSSWKVSNFTDFFELPKQDVVEIFRTSPLGDIAIEVANPEALKNITLNAKKVDEFSKNHNIRIMVFFCNSSSFEVADVEIRVFCSKLYELEDVVCGSANISVSRILYNKYGVSKYKVVQPFKFLKTGKIGGYQELEYLPKKQILILNGFAEIKKERFIFEPLDIEFDANLNPISQTEDYHLLKGILTDIEVMKTSTFLAGGIPENDHDLHFLMNYVIEKDERFKKDYGLQKIWHIGFKEYIGVMGLVRTERNLLDGGILLRSKYIGSGIGFWAEKCLFENLEKVNGTMIASVWEENKTAIKLIKSNGMSFVNKTSKSYKDRNMIIDVYIKFSSKVLQNMNLINIENYLITNKISQIKKVI